MLSHTQTKQFRMLGMKAPDKNQLSPLCKKTIAANKHDNRDCIHKAPKSKN